MAQFAAFTLAQQGEEYVNEILTTNPSWVREDNIAVYDLNTPNRVVRQNYSSAENRLVSPPAKRHILGLVGGNEVSRIRGSAVDLESDLLGITRPTTHCPEREHLPPTSDTEIKRVNAKMDLKIDTTPVHLKSFQQWAYPSVMAPEPLRKETCSKPEKY
jgi:hypothetical protein